MYDPKYKIKASGHADQAAGQIRNAAASNGTSDAGLSTAQCCVTALLKYDAAVAAVAVARTTDEVADWENKVAAMHEYARRIRDRSVEIDMAEIKARCRLRRGQILLDLRAAGRLREGKPPKETVIDPGQLPPLSLDELEITRNESSECQRIATIAADAYERLVARCRAYMAENPNAHAIDVLRERDGPINGARSVMGSRQEPDDSLDYFPTPPWATRALCEHVLSPFTACKSSTAWEPACGEGHMAEPLGEYFKHVFATDVFDYGYGEIFDFLQHQGAYDADWIITNPPFNDKSEQFLIRALDQARVGVALFLRLQWLESIGRYERVFKPHPPARIAQFAERVPLHRGRFEPEGVTATAYLWIVWAKTEHSGRTEFVWIPPGQREALTRSDDATRFTTNPVTKRDSLPPHNPVTGELMEADA